MSIEVRELTHSYRSGILNTLALDNVSFKIEEGEFVGIIGHTGSGKSTLVQHLNGLLQPTSGQVLIDGEDLNKDKAQRRRLRGKVGLVFQYPEYQLFEETVAKDIAFGPKNMGLSEEEIDCRVRRALSLVQLTYEEVAESSPFELSGGQMRRVAIAGVLAMEPEILILDEPTAGLDPEGRDRILRMLEDIRSDSHVTILMVSHSMEDMARLATRLLVMSNGRLVLDGTPKEVFSQTDLMASIGLSIPETAKLCVSLRERGLELPAGLFRPEEIRDALLRLWKEKEAGRC